jgi:hypothetical protein
MIWEAHYRQVVGHFSVEKTVTVLPLSDHYTFKESYMIIHMKASSLQLLAQGSCQNYHGSRPMIQRTVIPFDPTHS